MAISAATVIIVAPEFSAEDTSRIDFFIQEAARYVNGSVWGAKADFAHALYTAHLLKVSSLNGAAGTLIKDEVGDLKRTYSDSNTTTSDLGTTAYGKQFEQMKKSLLISPMVVS